MAARCRWLVGALLLLSSCRDGAPSSAPANHAPPTASSISVLPVSSAPTGAERVKLHNDKGDTVPLHASQGDSAVSARVAGGTEVVVLERSGDGRWLRVRAPDGTEGWITRRYVSGEGDAGAIAPSSGLLPEGSIWRSRSECESAFGAGRRLPRPSGTARLGTWNIRWFPDGKPGKRASDEPTDVAWLACAIAWLGVDALALQEIKRNERARESLSTLVDGLNRLTRGSWHADFDDCPNEDAQHVGVLYDTRRVKAEPALTLASLNPHGEACKDNLRPGLGVYLTFPGGLDLHFVSVHSKSGPERRSLDLREKTLRALDRAAAELTKARADRDLLLAGDFNTMGCEECSPSVTPDDEIERMDGVLGKLASPLRRVRASSPCSEYHARHATLLDHFLASRGFAELPGDARAAVSGVCGEAACGVLPREDELQAQKRLSDHCPVVLDIPDLDRDS